MYRWQVRLRGRIAGSASHDGTVASVDRVALQRLIKGESDWNRDRLATLFGQHRADSIIGLLDRERPFADTSRIVTRNF